MNLLSKDSLLSQRDELKKEQVELEGRNGFVLVREMTARERNVWEQSVMKPVGAPGQQQGYQPTLDDFYGKLAVSTICNENGDLLFTMKDARALAEKLSATNMEKIVKVAQRLNAISEKDKEEILKNSEADLEESSNSRSAEN